MGGSSKGGGGSTTKQQLDPMLKPYVEFALKEGKSQYQDRVSGYQPYSGQTVAGFSPDTQNYFSGVRDLTAGTQGVQQAQDIAGQAASGVAGLPAFQAGQFGGVPLGQAQIEAYQNPFTQDVINAQMQSMQQRAGEEAAALRTRQAGARALGGSRAAVESALQDRFANQQMAETEAALRSSGYQQALAAAQEQQARELQAQRDAEQSRQFAENAGLARGEFGLSSAARIAALAQAERDMETQRLDALKSIGTQQQALTQAELDDAYKRYLEGRDWQKNELADYAAIAYGAPAGSTQKTTQSVDPWSTIGGLAMYGIGTFL